MFDRCADGIVLQGLREVRSVAVDPHPDLGWRGLYTGGGMLREESHVHSDSNQQTVNLAVYDSGDDQNDDQAEGRSLLDERSEFNLDDGAGQEPSFPRELRRLSVGISTRSADIARFTAWAGWIVRAGGSSYGNWVDQCGVNQSGV